MEPSKQLYQHGNLGLRVRLTLAEPMYFSGPLSPPTGGVYYCITSNSILVHTQKLTWFLTLVSVRYPVEDRAARAAK